MSARAGQLLWARHRFTLTANIPLTIDTGLTVVNRSYPVEVISNLTVNPPLGIETAIEPLPGTLPASRVHVIPLSPIGAWASVFHGEPFFDPTTETVKVVFTYVTEGLGTVDINVLFWCPHTSIGPGEAYTYAPDGG